MRKVTLSISLLMLLGSMAATASAAMIGHWKLNGNGTALPGTNGALINGPTPVADRFGTVGGALSFNGATQQYMSIAGGGGLNNLQQGTISMFVRWSGSQEASPYGSFGNVLGRQRDNGFSNNILGLSTENPATARVTWQPYDAFNPVALTGGTSVGDGVWRHVAVTFSSGSHTLYIDGNIDGLSSASGSIRNDPSVPLTLGAWVGHGNTYSTATVDDLRIYNHVLSPSEIAAIPEPSTALLLGLGLIGMAARRRV